MKPLRRGEKNSLLCGIQDSLQTIPDRGKPDLFSCPLATVWCFGWRETGTRFPTRGLFRACNWLLANELQVSKECAKQGLFWAWASYSDFCQKLYLELEKPSRWKRHLCKKFCFWRIGIFKRKRKYFCRISQWVHIPRYLRELQCASFGWFD